MVPGSLPPAMATKEDMRIMAETLDTDLELWRPVSIPKENCKGCLTYNNDDAQHRNDLHPRGLGLLATP